MRKQSIKAAAAGAAMVSAMFACSAVSVNAAAPVYDWSGFYIGAHGGGGWADVDVTPGSLSAPGSPGTSFDADGALFGALAGYNFQRGNFVYGLEGDVSFGSIDGDNETLTVPNIDVKLMASLRARAGFVFDNVLVFATAGYAYADVDSHETHGAPDNGGSSETHSGPIVGLGAEYAISEDLAVRAEYEHTFFDEQRHTFPPGPHTHGIDFDTDVVRVALVLNLN